jgi:hypothetical protein
MCRRRMRWLVHATLRKGKRNACKVLVRILGGESDHLEELSMNGRTVLNFMFKRWD